MWRNRHDAAVMNCILNAELPRARDVRPIDPELERIIEKALAFDQRQRYQTAQDLQNDLDTYISSLGGASTREIGKVVAELFADTRAETQRLIEVQLSKVASLTGAEWAATQPGEMTASTTTHLGYEAGSNSGVTVQPVRTRSNRWLFGLAGLLLVGVGLWLVLGQQATAETPAASRAAAQAAQAPSTVRLHITAFPGNAKVFIDGELAPSNPFSRNFTRESTAKHKVVIEAPDHQSETREVVFDADTDLVITLLPTPTATATATATTAPRAPAAKPNLTRASRRSPAPVRASPPARSADCDPPYFVDARGVKKFKPQCLR
jgi:serine/threonine-protein kinase